MELGTLAIDGPHTKDMPDTIVDLHSRSQLQGGSICGSSVHIQTCHVCQCTKHPAHVTSHLSRHIQLKARADLSDQTAEFISFEVNKHDHFSVFLPTFGYKCTYFG